MGQALCPHELVRPRLSVDVSLSGPPLPPGRDGNLDGICRFKVSALKRHNSTIEIPDAVLQRVFVAIRQALARAADYLAEIDARYFHLSAIEPDGRPGERYLGNDGLDEFFLWAVELLSRCADVFPEWTAAELSQWPPDEQRIFDKLRIFAWSKPAIPPITVHQGIMGLSDASFWSGYLQREVLHLLRARWISLSGDSRTAILARPIHTDAGLSPMLAG